VYPEDHFFSRLVILLVGLSPGEVVTTVRFPGDEDFRFDLGTPPFLDALGFRRNDFFLRPLLFPGRSRLARD